MASSGPVRVRPTSVRRILGNNAHYNQARDQLDAYLQETNYNAGNLFARDAATMRGTGVVNTTNYAEQYDNVTALGTQFPANGLGSQLRTVAETISIRNGLNARRQVFFVGIGGFDSHDNQAVSVPALQSQIGGAIKAFRDAMVELNVWNDVTLFTAADFGRTMNDNGDGTDHGWGAHHFVAGGSVRGGRIFGDLPNSDATSDDYTDDRGRLIPTTSVEQYAATLGSWFGLEQTELDQALPNLANFNDRDLGFMV